MKPPGINPLTGPHLRILDFHAENRKVTRLRFPVPLSLSKTGQGAPLRRSMPMDFGRRRGVVTGVILVLIVAAASLIMNLVRSLYSRCEKQRFLWQAEQRTALFFSFCKAREGESFAREGHRLVVRGPKSGREPMYRLVVKTRKVGKALVKEEKRNFKALTKRSCGPLRAMKFRPQVEGCTLIIKRCLHRERRLTRRLFPSSWKATLTKSARRDLISLQGRSFRCHFGATLMWPAKSTSDSPEHGGHRKGPCSSALWGSSQ